RVHIRAGQVAAVVECVQFRVGRSRNAVGKEPALDKEGADAGDAVRGQALSDDGSVVVERIEECVLKAGDIEGCEGKLRTYLGWSPRKGRNDKECDQVASGFFEVHGFLQAKEPCTMAA